MAGKLVAFDAGHLLERGTDVALWDYAHFNETLLRNRSLILCPATADLSCLDKFRARFSVLLYRDEDDLRRALEPVDFYYRIDHGQDPGRELPRPPRGRLGIHCVFVADHPHGDVYAAISDCVAKDRSGGRGDQIPVVPFMAWLPKEDGDLRQELGIPDHATVFGRHGGAMTFDLPFVHETVRQMVEARPDHYYLFLNTRPFVDHPRVLFLPKTADMVQKTRFVNTCDAMLHGRSDGETFGLAVAEFSLRNKPVITWVGGTDRYHLEVLGDRALRYRDGEELARLLWDFHPAPWRGRTDLDCYSERFGPEPVMRQFAEVFLGEPAAAGGSVLEPKRRVDRSDDPLQFERTP